MKGVRPLDNREIEKVANAFTGVFEVRNKGLFMLGVSVGGRISELLALKVGDVYQNGKSVTSLHFDKAIVKGGEVSRAVPVNVDGRAAIDMLVRWHREVYHSTGGDEPLFPSRKQPGEQQLQAMTRKGRTRRAEKSLLRRQDSTASSRHIHCGNPLRSASISRQRTSTWCRSFLDIRMFRRRNAISVLITSKRVMPLKRWH